VQYNFLDRYLQGSSLVHRLDPRLKLLAALAFVVVATLIRPHAWPAYLLLAALAWTAVLVSGVPLSVALKRSAVALPFAGIVALSLPFTRAGQVIWAWHAFRWRIALTDQGLLLFVAVVFKAWLSVLVSGLLVATTPFDTVLVAMRALHAPAVLAAVISLMYRYLFVLVEEAGRLQTAREARSVGRGGTMAWRVRVLGGMIGSLFIRSYERSERIYSAMLSRGYAGQVLSLTPLAWRSRDSWIGLSWGVALVVVAAVGRLWPGL
jgi:cobalt/nickel transport system permease protein